MSATTFTSSGDDSKRQQETSTPSPQTAPSSHPRRKRRLVVPSKTDELEDFSNYYEVVHGEFGLLGVNSTSRVFPSSQVLSATIQSASAQGVLTHAEKKCPLITNFYKAIGESGFDDEAPEDSGNNEDEENTSKPEDIDNPEFSTITPGQHKRYLQLTKGERAQKRTQQEKVELAKLSKVITQEQIKYRAALSAFFEKHTARFLAAFQDSNHTAHPFVKYATLAARLQNQIWCNKPNKELQYGKYLQTFSVEIPRKAPGTKKLAPLVDFDSLRFEKLPVGVVTDIPCLKEFPDPGASINPPHTKRTPLRSPLCQDENAQRLAFENAATLITTSESLEALLQLPGEATTKWLSSVSTVDGEGNQKVIILDFPFRQCFRTPRRCLEEGLQEGVYQQLSNLSSDTTGKAQAPVQHSYYLWTLPTIASTGRNLSRQHCKIIVRTSTRLLSGGNPVCLRTHAEFFPERGRELASSYEKALWILDQKLLGAHSVTRTARIDSTTCKIIEWETTSTALALVDSEEHSSTNNKAAVDAHWHGMIQILCAVHSVPVAEGTSYLLSLPGRGVLTPTSSVTVHAVEKKTENAVVDLRKELAEADTVMMGVDPVALSTRCWRWDASDRADSTFPLKKV